MILNVHFFYLENDLYNMNVDIVLPVDLIVPIWLLMFFTSYFFMNSGHIVHVSRGGDIIFNEGV